MSDPIDGGRARAYRALVESEELYRATLGNISDAVFLTDDDRVFTFICPNVDVIFGYGPDEVQAMTQIDALLGSDLFDRATLAALGEIRNVEREITSKTGDRHHLLIHIKRVAIQASTVLYTCRDITERKQAEEELRAARLELAHSSRLALVGELVASIAHEINQPLMSIHTNAAAALRQLHGQAGPADVAELREILGDIRDQSRRAGDVIERVRALAARRPLERQSLDVNEVAGSIVRMVGGEARRRGVDLRTELGPSLPAIAADRVSLQQVVLNLMMNAMDATDQSEAEQRQVTVRTRRIDGGVEVAVSDTGHGIPPERLTRLFDAFFTTKEEGLGLGLAIVRSIVEAHDGRIWAEDHAGRGATFHVALPTLTTV
jgi:two-component system sensor kinase FixL